MGRKHSDNPRRHVLSQRYTAEELLAVQQAAADAGMDIKDWIRTRAVKRMPRGTVSHPTKTAKPPPARVPPAVYQELRKQGVNLNQIAHQLNANNLAPVPEIAAVVARIRHLLQPLAGANDGA